MQTVLKELTKWAKENGVYIYSNKTEQILYKIPVVDLRKLNTTSFGTILDIMNCATKPFQNIFS